MTNTRSHGAGGDLVGTLAQLLSRTAGPLVRSRQDPDAAFLGPHARSHAGAMARLSDEHWDTLIREYGLRDRGAILDVACGSGDWLAALARHNSRVVGIDLDDEMLAFARERSAGAADVELHKMSAEELDLPDAEFDVVTCFSSLPYFDQRAAIGEMSRVLKRGGQVVIGTVGPGYYAKHIGEGMRHDDVTAVRYGLDALLVAAARRVRGDGFASGSLRAWSPRAVRNLLNDAGLSVDRVVKSTDPIDPAWPNSFLGRPLYFTVFATKPTT